MKRPTGRPPTIPAAVVRLIRERGSRPLAYGEQKVIALDYGVSCQHVCQILKGLRRQTA